MTTTPLESDEGLMIGTISVFALVFAAFTMFFGFKFFKGRGPQEMAEFFRSRRPQNLAESPDVNPTYGDYEDYAEPVVEVEDSNMYYSEVYVEGTSMEVPWIQG